MVNLQPFATALAKLWNRLTPEPPFAFLAGALVNPVTGATLIAPVIVAGVVTNAVSIAGGVAPSTQVVSVDGAITIKSGTVQITKGSAWAGTLAAPTAGLVSAGGDDGKRLRILSTTAFAHTVTQTTPGFNNGSTASDVATFGTAIGNSIELEALGGVWYTFGTAKGVTLG